MTTSLHQMNIEHFETYIDIIKVDYKKKLLSRKGKLTIMNSIVFEVSLSISNIANSFHYLNINPLRK